MEENCHRWPVVAMMLVIGEVMTLKTLHVVENRPLPMKHWSISKLNSLSNRNTFSVVVVECETITLKSTNSISIPAKHFCYTLSMLLRWYDLSWAQWRNYDSELTGMLLALLSRADLRSMEDCGGTTDGLAVSYPARQCCTNSTHSLLATRGHVIFNQSQDRIFNQSQDRIFDQSQDRIRRSNYPTMYKGQPSDCLLVWSDCPYLLVTQERIRMATRVRACNSNRSP